MSGERSGIGKENIKILEEKKKTANMMGRVQKLNNIFSRYWFTKLLIKPYCYPSEREKSKAFLNLFYSFYCF